MVCLSSESNTDLYGIEMHAGENFTIQIEVTDSEGEPIDLTGATITFTLRKKLACEPVVLKLSTDIATEGAITDEEGGLAEIYIAPEDTELLVPGQYVYDLWVDNLPPGLSKHILVPPVSFCIKDPVRAWTDA